MYNLLTAGETYIQREMEAQLKAQCFTPTGTGAAAQQQEEGAGFNDSHLSLHADETRKTGFKKSGLNTQDGQPHLDELDTPDGWGSADQPERPGLFLAPTTAGSD